MSILEKGFESQNSLNYINKTEIKIIQFLINSENYRDERSFGHTIYKHTVQRDEKYSFNHINDYESRYLQNQTIVTKFLSVIDLIWLLKIFSEMDFFQIKSEWKFDQRTKLYEIELFMNKYYIEEIDDIFFYKSGKKLEFAIYVNDRYIFNFTLSETKFIYLKFKNSNYNRKRKPTRISFDDPDLVLITIYPAVKNKICEKAVEEYYQMCEI